MKSTIIAMMAAATLTASAAIPSYKEAKLVDLPSGAFHPVLSPDGSRLLFSTMDHTGLQCLDMRSGALTEIDTESAAGFEPVFSSDGNTVYYRTSRYVDGLIWRDVRGYDLATSTRSQIAKPSRDNVALKGVGHTTFATSALDKINVTIDGKTSYISPIDDARSYLWVSLSPDGKRVLFCEGYQGIFTCDLDGSNLQKVSAKGDFPRWIDNNTIAMLSQAHDGYFVTSSRLVVCDLTTKSQTRLTDESILVDEITTSSKTGTIIYATSDGEMYMLERK